MPETQGRFSVVLSVAKDLIAACHWHEILRCAQDDIGGEGTNDSALSEFALDVLASDTNCPLRDAERQRESKHE